MVVDNKLMTEKTCLITGANSGLGKQTVLELARMNATVIMVARNKERGEAALTEIKAKTGNEMVDLFIADLSSMNSVRRLAEDIRKRYSQLHVLVNNAGVMSFKRKVTADGHESQFAINHLGHFLLTNLLLDIIKASTPARIVNVSSRGHHRGNIDFEDLNSGGYGQSKLANVLFTYELAKRLEGTGVTVNALHPGVVKTNLGQGSIPRILKPLTLLGKPFMKNVEKGARTQVYLATSLEVEHVTGKYFVNCKESKSSAMSHDENLQRRLWEISEELTGLK
ncbi:MAG: SDR family oxidoreductase [Candidatus Hodarchaeales archaeon]|jgi:NAD(P)-dependent dehydrogenase (short-subunit alcohol dehydrogenase family)